MTIALDASTPAAFTGRGAVSSATSASFTPPLNAWLILKVGLDSGSGPTLTVTNTGSGLGAWSASLATPHNDQSAYIYRALVTSSVATTVTVGSIPAVDADCYLEVWTGGAASQTTAAIASSSALTAATINPTVTTTANGSQVTGIAVSVFGTNLSNVITSTDSGAGVSPTATNFCDFAAYKAANTPSSGTVVALNYTSSFGGGGWENIQLEILAGTGGPTNTASIAWVT